MLHDCVRLGADLEQSLPQGSYRHAGLCSHTRAAMESRRKAGRRVGEVGRRRVEEAGQEHSALEDERNFELWVASFGAG